MRPLKYGHAKRMTNHRGLFAWPLGFSVAKHRRLEVGRDDRSPTDGRICCLTAPCGNEWRIKLILKVRCKTKIVSGIVSGTMKLGT